MEEHDRLDAALDALGLLKPPRDAETEPSAVAPRTASEHLSELCDQGRLVGGLSFARGVRPDEAIGPLCHALGGSALGLRVEDVFEEEGRRLTLVVSRAGTSHRWTTPDLRALVAILSRTFADDRSTAVPLVLGETEQGALQVLAVPRERLERLLRAPGFIAETLDERFEEAPTATSEAPPKQAATPIARHGLRIDVESPEALRGEVQVSSEVERFELGRGRSADLTLDAEGVARVHAVLVRRGGWRLRPGPGAPEVRVDGAPVPPEGVTLASTHQVVLGPVRLRLTILACAALNAPL